MNINTRYLICYIIPLMLVIAATQTAFSDFPVWITTFGANLRSGPGTEYDIVATGNYGDEFTAVETTENGWYKVILSNGNFGYVSPRITTTDSSTLTGAITIQQTDTSEVISQLRDFAENNDLQSLGISDSLSAAMEMIESDISVQSRFYSVDLTGDGQNEVLGIFGIEHEEITTNRINAFYAGLYNTSGNLMSMIVLDEDVYGTTELVNRDQRLLVNPVDAVIRIDGYDGYGNRFIEDLVIIYRNNQLEKIIQLVIYRDNRSDCQLSDGIQCRRVEGSWHKASDLVEPHIYYEQTRYNRLSEGSVIQQTVIIYRWNGEDFVAVSE